MPVFRSVSRRATPNMTGTSIEEGGAGGPGLARASSLLREDGPEGGAPKNYKGILLKQKGTMKSWPQRFCWTEDGRFCWAEPSKSERREHGKERGGLLLSELTGVVKNPTAEKPFLFTVHTADRTINFCAESAEDLDAWIDVLTPPRPAGADDDDVVFGDEGDGEVRFAAHLVRSEEVVVTCRPNCGVLISKYVGGGFRLRLDELQRGPLSVPLAPDIAHALGLPELPQCVVARGAQTWSAAEQDGGSCFLARTGAVPLPPPRGRRPFEPFPPLRRRSRARTRRGTGPRSSRLSTATPRARLRGVPP